MAAHDRSEPGAASQGAAAHPDLGQLRSLGPGWRSWRDLARHADQIRRLAAEYEVGLVDSFAAFGSYVAAGGDATDLLSWSNHPNRQGHELVARELLRWFAML